MVKFLKKIINNKRINFYINILLLFFIVVFGVLYFKKDLKNVKIIREQDQNFAFTNPILDCENVDQYSNPILSYSKVKKEVDLVSSEYNVKEVSLYYRDLNNGPWIGINEDSIFSPASLLKTPVAIALFKYSEDHPDILNKKVVVTENDIVLDNNQNIKFPGVLEVGKEYTFLQIVEKMLQKSDNGAVGLILKNIPDVYTDEVFHSIGVPYKDVKNEVSLKVKDYAAFFRVLFNSSYLNRDMSEKLLEILSKTEYKDGLRAGVPDNITISHKFGERVIGDVYQLHDCGIVYYPNNPYLLCIMTKGNNFISQQNVIKELSKFIYSEVEKSLKN